jgi:hypothetical protein
MGAQDERAPGWYELPFKRLIKYIVVTFIIAWFASYLVTRLVNLDVLIWNFHMQYPWLFIPEGTVAVGTVYFWSWSRSSEKKKRQKQAKQQLQKLIHDAGGEKEK